MDNFLKMVGIRVIQGIIFGVVYALISYFVGDEINVLNIVYSSICYVVALCIMHAAAPYLQKLFGFDKRRTDDKK